MYSFYTMARNIHSTYTKTTKTVVKGITSWWVEFRSLSEIGLTIQILTNKQKTIFLEI